MTTTKTETKSIAKQVTSEATKELPETRLRDTDANKAWTVITIPDCEWSKKAVQLLKDHKETYKEINMSHEWFRRLVVEYEVRRLPAVFQGNAYFGSYAELENYYKCSFVSSKEVY